MFEMASTRVLILQDHFDNAVNTFVMWEDGKASGSSISGNDIALRSDFWLSTPPASTMASPSGQVCLVER